MFPSKEGDGHHDEELPEEPSQTAEVILETERQQHHYKPHVVWIEPGGTVTWQLESGSHDAVPYHPDNDRPRRIPEGARSELADLADNVNEVLGHTHCGRSLY